MVLFENFDSWKAMIIVIFALIAISSPASALPYGENEEHASYRSEWKAPKNIVAKWLIPKELYAGRTTTAYFAISEPEMLNDISRVRFEKEFRFTISRPSLFMDRTLYPMPESQASPTEKVLKNDRIGSVDPGNMRLTRYVMEPGPQFPMQGLEEVADEYFHNNDHPSKSWDYGSEPASESFMRHTSDASESKYFADYSGEALPDSIAAEMGKTLGYSPKVIFRIQFNLPNSWYRHPSLVADFRVNIRPKAELFRGYITQPLNQSPLMRLTELRGFGRNARDLMSKASVSFDHARTFCKNADKCLREVNDIYSKFKKKPAKEDTFEFVDHDIPAPKYGVEKMEERLSHFKDKFGHVSSSSSIQYPRYGNFEESSRESLIQRFQQPNSRKGYLNEVL